MGLVWSKLLLDIEVVNAIQVAQMLQLFETLTVILQEPRKEDNTVSSKFMLRITRQCCIIAKPYLVRSLLHMLQLSLEVKVLSSGSVILLIG